MCWRVVVGGGIWCRVVVGGGGLCVVEGCSGRWWVVCDGGL